MWPYIIFRPWSDQRSVLHTDDKWNIFLFQYKGQSVGFIQQVVVKATVSPWEPTQHDPLDALHAPLSKVFQVLADVEKFRHDHQWVGLPNYTALQKFLHTYDLSCYVFVKFYILVYVIFEKNDIGFVFLLTFYVFTMFKELLCSWWLLLYDFIVFIKIGKVSSIQLKCEWTFRGNFIKVYV